MAFHAVACVGPGDGVSCLESDFGGRYRYVAKETGGVSVHILDPIDDGLLAIIDAIVAQSGLRVLELAGTPLNPSSVEVWLDGEVLPPERCTLDATENRVVLAASAPNGAELVVRWPIALCR